jgi:hypothetical protein
VVPTIVDTMALFGAKSCFNPVWVGTESTVNIVETLQKLSENGFLARFIETEMRVN